VWRSWCSDPVEHSLTELYHLSRLLPDPGHRSNVPSGREYLCVRNQPCRFHSVPISVIPISCPQILEEVVIKNRSNIPKHHTMSRDTEIICYREIGQWLVGKIPARPNIYAITPLSMRKQPAPTLSIAGTFDTKQSTIAS
jgi:hypothetical protein